MSKYYLLLLCACFLIVSCSSIQHTSQLSQPVGIKLTAGVGDLVISLSKEKNLPNVFGKADIFGRKTSTGMTTIQYLGVRNNKAIFKRKSVVIETGATTMNSTPLVIPNSSTTTHSGMIGGTMYSGTSTTVLPSTVIPARPPKAQTIDQDEIEISVDLSKKNKQIFVEGHIITIEKADNIKLTYSISD